MAIKPIGSRILIEVRAGEEKTASGLLIPTAAQEKTNTGTVLAIGDKDITVKVGQIVVFDKYAGTQIVMDSNEQLLLDMENVLAIVE